jgi:NAD+-dependent protein deacetylase sirtuin 5
VDGLSVRAFRTIADPSREPDLFEMHGHLFDTICTACGDRERNLDSPICPALAGTEELVNEADIPQKDLPRCRKCAGLLRPGVVWFKEMPYNLKEIGKIVGDADLALVVGTSSTVCFHGTCVLRFYLPMKLGIPRCWICNRGGGTRGKGSHI